MTIAEIKARVDALEIKVADLAHSMGLDLDDPLVALWAKHADLNGQRAPEGATDDEATRFVDNLADQLTVVEAEILSTPAKTMAGARVHIALLAWYHVDAGPPHVLQPHVERMADAA